MLLDPSEGPSVDLTTAVLADRLSMCQGRIPLVAGEIIERIDTVVFHHQPVPGDLGHDGGRSDGETAGVTPLDCPLGEIEGDKINAIDEEKVGCWIEAQDRRLHGPEGGLQDIILLYIPRSHNPHPPAEGAGGNDMIKLLSLSRGKELGVAHPGDLVARPGDNRTRYHRTGQRAPARLIHPRHPLIALGADQLLYRYLVKGCWTALAHFLTAAVAP
jgi:hypothetical protein